VPEGDFSLPQSRVAVVGLGLMGGSLALALKGKCTALYGIDPDRATLELALDQAVVDRAEAEPARLLPEADIVILAAPVPAILSLLDQLPSLAPNPCIVLDLGSTKQRIVEAMSRLPERFDPLGGHPLCGKERLSLANAEATLYHGAAFLLTPLERTTARALSTAHQMIEAVGATAVTVDAAEHDRLLAATSHLPFVLSSALALSMPTDAAPFIGPGFRSASRLAGTPSSMMAGVLLTNRANTLQAIASLQQHLGEIQAALAAGDRVEIESILDDARQKYQELLSPFHNA
jgi:prephenate dehydrogenase